MTEIIEYIDEAVIGCLNNTESLGLCHLVEDNNGIYPTGYTSESRKVTPTGRDRIFFYHRLLNGSYDFREDISFGRNRTRENTQRIRTVVFIPIDFSKSDIDDFINSLPDVLTVDGYRSVKLSNSVDLIRDSASVWNDEYGEAHRKAYQKNFQVYAVEYSVEYIKCNECVSQ